MEKCKSYIFYNKGSEIMDSMISSSLCKYLITIYELKNMNSVVYQIDIATSLGHSRASVSRAIHVLQTKKLITIENKNIIFTHLGNQIVQSILNEYHIFYQILEKFQFNSEEAKYYANQLISISDNYFFQKIKDYYIQHIYE